ncbi:Hypothetical predicted protein, partial [Paramuricea clavata]
MDEIHEIQLREVLPYEFEPVLNENAGSSGAEAIPRASRPQRLRRRLETSMKHSRLRISGVLNRAVGA